MVFWLGGGPGPPPPPGYAYVSEHEVGRLGAIRQNLLQNAAVASKQAIKKTDHARMIVPWTRFSSNQLDFESNCIANDSWKFEAAKVTEVFELLRVQLLRLKLVSGF